TQGLGVDHIVEIDLPGNIRLDEHVLAERGAIVSFGAASVPTIPITQLGRRARNFSLHFIFLYLISDDTANTVAEAVTQAASGPLRHRISGQFALDELARAHEAAERSAGSGHLIVTI